MPLSSRDFGGMLDIIDAVYSIPDRGEMFQEASRKLDRLIGISGLAARVMDL